MTQASQEAVIVVRPSLSLWDAVSIIVGIVIGTAIFRSAPMVFQNASSPAAALAIWAFGGFLSLMGAYCYAELATAFPRMGGEYEFLRRAYGSWMGFLFAWAQLIVVLTGSIASVAYAFADYAAATFGGGDQMVVALSAGIIVVLSLTNAAGIVFGKAVQNVLSVLKIAALVVVCAVAARWGDPSQLAGPSLPLEGPGFGLALVFVLYAYGGWNECAFVAAEIKDRDRDLPRALFLGLAIITILYILVNAAYVAVLGFDGARATKTPAADVLQHVFGDTAGRVVSAMIMLSAAGAINGMILTSARVYVALGHDHPTLSRLARWDPDRAAPLTALAVQAVLSVAFVLVVGSAAGRTLLDQTLTGLGLPAIPWQQYQGGFEALVAGTAPVFWFFFFLSGTTVVVLRYKYPHVPRPFRVPLYPLPVVVFCASCLYMLYSALDYARYLTLIGIVPLALGVPMLLLDMWYRNKGRDGQSDQTETG